MPEKKLQSAGSVEELQKTLDKLTAQLAALSARLEKVEAVGFTQPAAAPAPGGQPAAQPLAGQTPGAQSVAAEPAKDSDEFSEELLLVLSAAVAAYLGKRPHIRAIRLHGSSAWAQQGRVFVQASHQLNVPHEA
jgi:methylmalonyl-CoA carboxyltransferase large subunit